MNKIVFDFSKLRGRIKEFYGSEQKFSKKVKISASSLSSKLNNKTYFNSSEVVNLSKALEIPDDEVNVYFFRKKVRKTELKN
jgi:hypothetical protein